MVATQGRMFPNYIIFKVLYLILDHAAQPHRFVAVLFLCMHTLCMYIALKHI